MTTGVRFPVEAGIFFFGIASRQALEPIKPPFQWERGTTSPRVKQPKHEADHLPPPIAEVKNACSIPTLPTSSRHGT
jgi:hypothetical protein